MQDLASELSRNFQGWYPGPHSGRPGDSLPHQTPKQASRCWDLSLGSPQLFSHGCAAGVSNEMHATDIDPAGELIALYHTF